MRPRAAGRRHATMRLVAAASTSWQDTWTAIGTVITGAAAVLGLGATIWLSRRDRLSREREGQVSAAVEILALLDTMQAGLSWLWNRRPAIGNGPDLRANALEARRVTDNLLTPQIRNKKVQRRVHALCELLHEIGYGSLASEAPHESSKRNRAETDVANYLGYVRRTLNAFVEDRRLPHEKEPPILRRDGDQAWQPPDIP